MNYLDDYWYGSDYEGFHRPANRLDDYWSGEEYDDYDDEDEYGDEFDNYGGGLYDDYSDSEGDYYDDGFSDEDESEEEETSSEEDSERDGTGHFDLAFDDEDMWEDSSRHYRPHAQYFDLAAANQE